MKRAGIATINPTTIVENEGVLNFEKDKKISELEIKLLELSHNQTIPNEFSVLS